MVVKPLSFAQKGRRDLTQPAVKCRGREYLRIIHGPEYTRAEQFTRLRQRSLARKRSLAIREFALGVESLERFVCREPLRRVHECVFGVLALEKRAGRSAPLTASVASIAILEGLRQRAHHPHGMSKLLS